MPVKIIYYIQILILLKSNVPGLIINNITPPAKF